MAPRQWLWSSFPRPDRLLCGARLPPRDCGRPPQLGIDQDRRFAMRVLDEENYLWFLMDEDGQLYLDAVCSHSAVDYLFLLRLNEEEVALFRDKGRTYLNELAYRIHHSSPGVQRSKSPYKSRTLVMTPERERADAAISDWRDRHRNIGPQAT